MAKVVLAALILIPIPIGAYYAYKMGWFQSISNRMKIIHWPASHSGGRKINHPDTQKHRWTDHHTESHNEAQNKLTKPNQTHVKKGLIPLTKDEIRRWENRVTALNKKYAAQARQSVVARDIQRKKAARARDRAKHIVHYAPVKPGTFVHGGFAVSASNPVARSIIENKYAKRYHRGIGTPVQLEPCPAGWHNDGLICREPITCAKGWDFFKYGCRGGNLRGRLNHGGVCPPGKHKEAGLCYVPCKKGYIPEFFTTCKEVLKITTT